MVTVLFSDLAGSTALGERLDPEQMRELMARYFAAMQAVIEGHGGTVEKFIGDAIMAVFGVPTVHEDDALRAVRAAAEMREALAELNATLEGRGILIQTRTGLNTGEVVTGDPAAGGTMVTGDTVNTAARLQQAAGLDEVLLADTTLRLVRDAVSFESVGPLDVKGKASAVVAHRLLAVRAGVPGHVRRATGQIVGRDAEIALLRRIWDEAVRERRSRVVVVLGMPGVGKSRLVSEFLDQIRGDATVLRGRCLPYGDGITFWPLAEVVRTAAGIQELDDAEEARAKVRALLKDSGGETAAARLEEVIGLSEGGAAREDLFWAVRRTFETVIRRGPLVVVWDDLHWAESTFMDLVEYLATWIREAPFMTVIMARPELREMRPAWGDALPQGAIVTLEPLSVGVAGELIAALPGGVAVPAQTRERIHAAAEGNPLFLEEMVAMLIDEGHLVATDSGWVAKDGLGDVAVPPSITALLTARLERLPIAERAIAERASVVGRVFERGAVVELSPPAERPGVTSRLLSLIHKDIVRPEPDPGLGGDDAYRFRHLLIRDAAYHALPKAERASLHEAFAAWLERAASDRIGEYTEIVAHHLEQAYLYRADLGDFTVEVLGRRAAAELAHAGRRALARGDLPAAIGLRARALALPMPPGDRAVLMVQLARALQDTGQADEAARRLDAAAAAAEELADESLGMQVTVGRGFLAILSMDRDLAAVDAVRQDAERAVAHAERVGDAAALARALELLAFCAYFGLDRDAAGKAWRAAAQAAERSGDFAEEARILPLLPATATYGWATTAEAIAYCHALVGEHPDSPMLRARALAIAAWQRAERGEFAEARDLAAASRTSLEELGLPWVTAEIHLDYADVASLTGDPVAAEREAREGYELGQQARHRSALILLDSLAEALWAQGRRDATRACVARATVGVEQDDPSSRGRLEAWVAIVAATDGDGTKARDIIDRFETTSDPHDDAIIHTRHAEALEILGDTAAAISHLEAARAIHVRKEELVRLGRVEQSLARFRATA